jgi:hypothetical protein
MRCVLSAEFPEMNFGFSSAPAVEIRLKIILAKIFVKTIKSNEI